MNHKNRLVALDGLRGFAALAVLLSHSNFDMAQITHSPVLVGMYKTLAVGPNSVQILFVLCGFFMAYLYPTISKPVDFIQKRYLRIFPVFATVCLYLFGLRLFKISQFWYLRLTVLFITILGISFIWFLLRRLNLTVRISRFIFWSFISLQTGMLLFGLLILPRLYHTTFPTVWQEITIFLTNITLTQPFTTGVVPLSGVFWSLSPEVYFYLLYPLLGIPLLVMGAKQKAWLQIVLFVSLAKILFDLDVASYGFASLFSLHPARATGFMVGALIGTVYQEQGKRWFFLKKYIASPALNLFLLGSFILIQYGDWSFRDAAAAHWANWYFFISSIVIGGLIIGAVIPNTIIRRIFSYRLFRFLGMISYSLYLIHLETIAIGFDLTTALHLHLLPKPFNDLTTMLVSVGLSIGIAVILYHLIESNYFRYKKDVSLSPHPLPHHPAWRYGFILAILIIVGVYATTQVPTLLLHRHPQQTSHSGKLQEMSLLSEPVRIAFTAEHDNLAITTFLMRYAIKAQKTQETTTTPAQLVFRLFEGDSATMIFESKRNAYMIEGEPYFPFGFPIQTDSRHKKYIVELELENGSTTDQVYLTHSLSSFTAAYTVSKPWLIRHPHLFILNRLTYVATNSQALFALVFIGGVGLSLRRHGPVNGFFSRKPEA